MLILGLDPGSIKAGYALIKKEERKLIYLDSGVLRYKNSNFIHRLGDINTSCKNLMTQFSPDEVALESLIYVKNVNSLAKLAQARGAMIAAFLEKLAHESIFEYAPNLVKSSVTGHGHASKEQVDKALSLIFGNKTFSTNDESDALAIAVCHALHTRRRYCDRTHSRRSDL